MITDDAVFFFLRRIVERGFSEIYYCTTFSNYLNKMSRLKAFWKCAGVKQNLKFCQSETVCFAFLHLLCNHSSVVTSGTLNNVVYHVVA